MVHVSAVHVAENWGTWKQHRKLQRHFLHVTLLRIQSCGLSECSEDHFRDNMNKTAQLVIQTSICIRTECRTECSENGQWRSSNMLQWEFLAYLDQFSVLLKERNRNRGIDSTPIPSLSRGPRLKSNTVSSIMAHGQSSHFPLEKVTSTVEIPVLMFSERLLPARSCRKLLPFLFTSFRHC